MASLRMLRCALREFRNRYAWQLPGAAGGFARNPEDLEKSMSNKTIPASRGVGPTRLFRQRHAAGGAATEYSRWLSY